MHRFVETARLTHVSFKPTSPDLNRRRRQLAAGALLLLLLAAGYGFAGDLFLSARDIAELRSERDRLAADAERLRTELAVERAKRVEVERHSEDLNAQVAELNGQVAFLKTRKVSAKSAD